MPNRMIHDSIKTSPTLDGLSFEGEATFYRLLTVADDFGRFDADRRVLCARCFPLRIDRIAVADFGRWYDELVQAGLVCEYEVGVRRYGYFPTWTTYQRLRAKSSKFPAPPDEIAPTRPAAAPARAPAAPSDQKDSTSTWPSPEALIALYNTTIPAGHPHVTKLSDGRKKKARAYLKQFPSREFWEGAFGQLSQSEFLRGQRSHNGHEGFVADFDWLLSKGKDATENVVKVAEGKYRDRAPSDEDDDPLAEDRR